MKNIISTFAVLMLLVGGTAYADNCASTPHSNKEAGKIAPKSGNATDIVGTAIESGKFSMLVAAVKAAGLVEALKGEGPFTVFAPNDKAFAELPEGTLDALLADPDKLKKILTYHVVSGAVTSDQVVGLKSAETLNGKSVKIATTDGQVMINDANVIAADIMCKNGVIHVLDKVIMPMEESR
jgi:uncharacterized surface protein with fasciclin (FAS1) repeats